MKLGEQGEIILKHYESCRLRAYQDGGGVWTIAYGNTTYESGKSVKKGDVIPQWRADSLFNSIAFKFAGEVTRLLPDMYIQQNKFDALVSLAWNIGLSAFEKSTLLKKVLANPNAYKTIDKQFMRWVYDNGIAVKGLINRRESESWLYVNNEVKFFNNHKK